MDADGDGLVNAKDNCIGTLNPDQTDSDGDGFGDACDKCPFAHVLQGRAISVAGNEQNDLDLLYGSPDADEDGVLNAKDNCPLICNPAQQDSDKDGIYGDACEPNTTDYTGCPVLKCGAPDGRIATTKAQHKPARKRAKRHPQ